MIELPYTVDNKKLVQDFIDETRKRISDGVEIKFVGRAIKDLEDLQLQYDITADDIEYAILNLTPENYYRGIDPSHQGDYDLCAFRTFVGKDKVEIYLKYGLQKTGLEVLVFSNHIPEHPMSQPFKN